MSVGAFVRTNVPANTRSPNRFKDWRQDRATTPIKSYPEGSGRNKSDIRDPNSTRLQLWRWRCRRILSTQAFDTFVGLVIVGNCVTIGLDQANRLKDKDASVTLASTSAELEAAENIFLAIYAVELAMRFFGFGWPCIRENWVKFDCVLVACSLVSWSFPLFFEDSEGGAGALMVLRTIRLARLARTIRLLIKFRVLWMLVRGLLSSAETMFYTLSVLMIMLYVFATIGIELVTLRTQDDVPDEEFQLVVDQYFSTLTDTMMTLMQFACLDSIGVIFRPLIKKDLMLAVYFMAIILIIPIVLMNLVTAIIVNSAMEQASQDQNLQKLEDERIKAGLLKKAAQIFRTLDQDDTNSVSRQEMEAIGIEEKELLSEMCGLEDPLAIFDSLDVDESGELDIDEFCDGMWRAVTAKTPIEMQRMEKQIKVICNRQRESEKRQDELYSTMRIVRKVLQRMEEVLNCAESPMQLKRMPMYSQLSFESGSQNLSKGLSKVETVEAPAFGRNFSPEMLSSEDNPWERQRSSPRWLSEDHLSETQQSPAEVRRLSTKSSNKLSINSPTTGPRFRGSATARSKDSLSRKRSRGNLSLKVQKVSEQRSSRAVREENDRLKQELAAVQLALSQRQQGDSVEREVLWASPPAKDVDKDDAAAKSPRPSPWSITELSIHDPESRRIQL